MNNYKIYSNSTAGIEVCSDVVAEGGAAGTSVAATRMDDSLPFQSDLSDQPCRMAKSRGKNGVLRIGGGENFDKTYRAVNAYNQQAQDNAQQQNGNGTTQHKFHMVGGGAGTVR